MKRSRRLLSVDGFLAKLRNLEGAVQSIFELTTENGQPIDTSTVVRSVHRIARGVLNGSAITRTPRCQQPICQLWHTPDEASQICGVTTRTLYNWEKHHGLKVSRKSGYPRYRHDRLDDFMLAKTVKD